ncbi:unnamed protein product, partial [Durusdinium trenchii]
AAKFCRGHGDVECTFGPKGKRAQPNGPQRCLFCDPDRLTAALEDAESAPAVAKRFKQLSPEQSEVALQRVTDASLRQQLQQAAQQKAAKYCQGYGRTACTFGANGQAAQPNGPATCIFCDPQRLNDAFLDGSASLALKKRFARSSAEQRPAVLQRVTDPGFREWLQGTGPAPAQRVSQVGPEVRQVAAVKHQLARTEPPYDEAALEALYEKGRAMWAEALDMRQLAGAPLRTDAAFRERVVEDRKKALNMLGIAAERLPRGREVDNRDPLPRARSTEQAAALQFWAEFNSWGVCSQCKALQPRELTPQSMEKVLSPWIAKSGCIFCRNQRRPPQVPGHADFVKQVTPEILAALRPVECDFGPFQVSKDKFGRGNGYRVKSALVTFAWAEKPVEERVQALPRPEAALANRVLEWLWEHSGPGPGESAYGQYWEAHDAFLQANPQADRRQRKRWLRFLEGEGLECALWPHLFLRRDMCLTWARLQSTSRQSRGSHKSTLEQRARGQAADEEEEVAADVTGTKRSYMALVLSPVLDFSFSYELLHFAFDLNLWTALGSKRNLHLGVPMRLLLKGHPFTSAYWRDMHRGLVDLIRQKGYPPVFSTQSPFEWCTPNHCCIVDGLAKMGA